MRLKMDKWKPRKSLKKSREEVLSALDKMFAPDLQVKNE